VWHIAKLQTPLTVDIVEDGFLTLRNLQFLYVARTHGVTCYMKIAFLSFQIAFIINGSISHSDNTRGGEIDQLEDLGVDGRLILKCIFKKWDRCVGWIDLV
jgi:hypothetical protein